MKLSILCIAFAPHLPLCVSQEPWEMNHAVVDVIDAIDKLGDCPFQATLELFGNELYKILHRKSHLDMRWITLRHTTLAKLITGKKRKIYWHRIRSRCWVCKPEPAQAILLFVVLIMVF